MDFLYYFLISAVVLVSCQEQDVKSAHLALFPPGPICRHEFDVHDDRCVSKAYCNGILNMGWILNSLKGKGFSCRDTYPYYGHTIGEVYYAFINMRDLNTLDRTYAQKIVSTLDISYNNFVNAPIIPAMERLKLLNLSRNDLTEAKLYNERPLQSLFEIDLSHNKITRILVDQDHNVFHQLKSINLSNNQLVVLENGIFDSFSKLETLDLSFNYIETLSILTFEGVKDLLNLNLKHNELSELSLSLVRFSKLITLDLSYNKIQNVKYSDYEKLYKLNYLDLKSNLITKIEEKAFSKMTEIQILNLSNNLLESVPNGTWESLSKLVNINLSKNNLKSLPVDLFKDKHITQFVVSENKLEGTISKYMFKGMDLDDDLDLSNQELMAIEDFAFDGLENLKKLLLNGNRLQSISKNSFSTLQRLEVLDLSNNLLTNINFDKDDLINLQSLLLHKNLLVEIKHDFFYGLNKLQFLDISTNNISQVESASFTSLENLNNLQILNNPISGILEENTFDGLQSLPGLDISGTFLTTITNESFNGMNEMKKFNASHSEISELQFNAFLNTGSVEVLDLSYNKLSDFNVNTTELNNLNTLILNNNFFTKISSYFFKDLRLLTKIIFSFNQIEIIDEQAFVEQKDMTFLDLSFNKKIKINLSQLEKAQSLDSVILSGILANIPFDSITRVRWSHLEMSHSNICNISSVRLQKIQNLSYLVLSNNNITKVEISAFQGVKTLKTLDLSFNNISFIQSGSFKDNTLLTSLNISHNMLKTVGYGIFRGLSNLNTVDMSYNEISDLQSERFYEVQSLRVLIVDHNKINTLYTDEFLGTNLEKLSIGENPIPCHAIVNMKKTGTSFTITAVRLDVNSDYENVDGITCNMDRSVGRTKHDSQQLPSNTVLIDIRDVLNNLSANIEAKNNSEFNDNITKTINEGNSNISFLLQNISSVNTNTNDILAKILSSINTFPKTDLTVPSVSKEFKNGEFRKGETARLSFEELHSRDENFDHKSLIFLKVCVGLILVLVLLVCTILFLLFRSGLYFPNHQIGARRLSEDLMEHSTL